MHAVISSEEPVLPVRVVQEHLVGPRARGGLAAPHGVQGRRHCAGRRSWLQDFGSGGEVQIPTVESAPEDPLALPDGGDVEVVVLALCLPSHRSIAQPPAIHQPGRSPKRPTASRGAKLDSIATEGTCREASLIRPGAVGTRAYTRRVADEQISVFIRSALADVRRVADRRRGAPSDPGAADRDAPRGSAPRVEPPHGTSITTFPLA